MKDQFYQSVKTVYFVRHGRSEDNAAPVFQAPTSPLDETGKKQAQMIAGRISNIQFDALIVSPFDRAKETGQAIADKTGFAPEYSELFIERLKPSKINGKPHTDTEANTMWRDWEESLYSIGKKIEDGENYTDIIARADRALEFLASRPEKTLVVVSHGFFIRTIFARVLLGDTLTPESFKRFQKMLSMENTALSVLRYQGAFEQDPTWKIWIYNDHAHLG